MTKNSAWQAVVSCGRIGPAASLTGRQVNHFSKVARAGRQAENAYLWEPEELQVELARSLGEGGSRAAVIGRIERRRMLKERGFLVLIPFDGAAR